MTARIQVAMGKLLRFLVLACVVQVAGAQGLFKGFVPDENGTNLDTPSRQEKAATVTIIKDCPDCPEMAVIPAGSFVMGSDKRAEVRPSHIVTIRSFLIGKTEVTQKLWFHVMRSNPSDSKVCGPECPVENVSWDEVQNFILKLNQKTGQKYRLPSESEWEYAARAGTTTTWSFGDDVSKLDEYAWHGDNSGGKTHAVGQKLPNPFGLFDIHGNVWEFTQDCWHESYVDAPADGSPWMTACTGNRRVLRGGSCFEGYWGVFMQSDHRIMVSPTRRWFNWGFRLARDL